MKKKVINKRKLEKFIKNEEKLVKYLYLIVKMGKCVKNFFFMEMLCLFLIFIIFFFKFVI